MKVVIVSPHATVPAHSGDRLRTVQLITALQEQGVDVHLVELFGGTQTFHDAPVSTLRGRPTGVRLLPWRARLAVSRRVDPFAIYRLNGLPAQLRAVIDDVAPDVVDFQHSYTWMSTRIPNVLTLHNVETSRLASAPGARPASIERVRAMERRAISGATRVVALSAADLDRAREVAPQSDPAVVPLGYRPAVPPRAPRLRPVETVGYVGSFEYEPNVDAAMMLIAAWPSIRATGVKRLVLAGRQAKSALGPRARVEGVEVLSDVESAASVVAGLDAVIVPLRRGGGVRVKIIEALALGVPVVSTPLGVEGLGVEQGVHAVVVQSADAADLAAGVEALGDPRMRQRLADNGRDLWQRRFSPEQMAITMLGVYRSACDHRT